MLCQISLKNMELLNSLFSGLFHTFNIIKYIVTLVVGLSMHCFPDIFHNDTYFWKNMYLVRV